MSREVFTWGIKISINFLSYQISGNEAEIAKELLDMK
jgi:hypothetical protein